MNFYIPTAEESRKNSTIQNSNLNYKKFALERKLEYAVFHYDSFGDGPYTPEETIMRARVFGKITALRTALAKRDSDLGQVTVDASKYDDKMLELPILREKIKPMIREAYPNDATILEFLYATGPAFEKGTQENMQTICETWLLNIATKPLVPDVLTLVTTWVDGLQLVLSIKTHKKENVTEDRDYISDLVDELFDALRKNYGELYSENSADIRPLLRKFNPTILKPNKKNQKKLTAKERDLEIAPNQIATAEYAGLVPKNYLVIDNTTNDCDGLIFVSIETPTGVPEFAFIAPKGKISKAYIPDIGPRYPKRINGKFRDPLFAGTIRITVKKRK